MKKNVKCRRIVWLLALSILLVRVPGASAELLKFIGSPHFLPAPLMVVGVYTPEGKANFAVFHRGGVLSSAKADGLVRIGFGVKGDAQKSWTYQCLKEAKVCTVNIPSLKLLPETELFGLFSGRPMADGKPLLQEGGGFQDKLKVSKLTAVKGIVVNAPMLEEFPISMECELEEEMTIDPESKSRLMILTVKKVWVDEAYLDAEGKVDPKPAGEDSSLVCFSHSHSETGGYLGLGEFLDKPYGPFKAYGEDKK